MNYKSIHDSIISRARSRTSKPDKSYESHHIIPKCEGGSHDGEQVFLTPKEHVLVHKLRYKMTGVCGNYMAYNLMKYGRSKWKGLLSEVVRKNGIEHHKKWKETDLEGYTNRQRKAGISGGNKCKKNQSGFFRLTEEEKTTARDKGRKTLVEKKIGMFSDEYREKHKKFLEKKVNTPDGIFDSLTDAAKYYNVTRGTMTYRINSKNFSEWYLIKQEKI